MTYEQQTVIRELQIELYNEIRSKGFMKDFVPIPEQIALMHSELSEALESYRNREPISFTVNGKPEGIASEYIDVIIRAFNYCSHLDIDVAREMERKRSYNLTRKYMHGGKLI